MVIEIIMLRDNMRYDIIVVGHRNKVQRIPSKRMCNTNPILTFFAVRTEKYWKEYIERI